MTDTHRPVRTATMKAFVVDKYGKDGPRAADVPTPSSDDATSWSG